ncbi:ATP synthase F1 subunit epsilon [Alphaproteobacteria bacterium]|nr:ATP synthase F1 subunit epsilon [Alphaproteobacteria bacterium]MDG1415368.1 ATP synthase F1 subunit epsilon [Alphaproteobacteria bacterium]
MTMQFELVTPEASEAQIEATMVVVPGAEGDMGVLENHAPTVTSLRPGVVSVTGSDGNTGFFVAGGFAEITAERCIILAESATRLSDLTTEAAQAALTEAKAALDTATSDGEKNIAERKYAVAYAMVDAAA